MVADDPVHSRPSNRCVLLAEEFKNQQSVALSKILNHGKFRTNVSKGLKSLQKKKRGTAENMLCDSCLGP